MSEQQSHEEQLGTVRCELEEFLGRATPTSEDSQEVESLVNNLERFKSSGKQATIPLVVAPVKFEENQTLNYRTVILQNTLLGWKKAASRQFGSSTL